MGRAPAQALSRPHLHHPSRCFWSRSRCRRGREAGLEAGATARQLPSRTTETRGQPRTQQSRARTRADRRRAPSPFSFYVLQEEVGVSVVRWQLTAVRGWRRGCVLGSRRRLGGRFVEAISSLRTSCLLRSLRPSRADRRCVSRAQRRCRWFAKRRMSSWECTARAGERALRLTFPPPNVCWRRMAAARTRSRRSFAAWAFACAFLTASSRAASRSQSGTAGEKIHRLSVAIVPSPDG